MTQLITRPFNLDTFVKLITISFQANQATKIYFLFTLSPIFNDFERRILQGLNPNLWTDLFLSDVLFFHTTHSGLNATNNKPLFIMSTSFGCQSWLERTNCFKFLYDIDIEKIGLLWPLFWELLVITTWFYN